MHAPKKHLGQNFLFDPSILKKIIKVAGVTGDDTVVEIGPGPGRLTLLLAGAAKKVIAIELDTDLCADLQEQVREYPNLEVILGDALQYPFENLEPFRVVANIPYYITTPIMFRLLEARSQLRSMTLTIQKEVAQRIVAKPGGKDYGSLSVAIQYYGEARLAFTVPRGAFRPVPKVDSAVLHVEILPSPRVTVLDEGTFFKVVRAAFSQRRKTLANSLKAVLGDMRDILIRAEIDPVRRAETLSIGEFGRLSDILVQEGRHQQQPPA
ncbi:MAG: 16S rRNA (adenine(1518)-N(6)/adenine(1519)-N(6))-dimethyltransferase RsmA [Thermodesulfovibrionales bacterium]|jgi:16S rRNA (adenine1518-N6/adenine1519-N6)-dimethyltransferase